MLDSILLYHNIYDLVFFAGNTRNNPASNQPRFPMQPNNMRPPAAMAPRHTQPNPINLPPPAPAPVRNVMVHISF